MTTLTDAPAATAAQTVRLVRRRVSRRHRLVLAAVILLWLLLFGARTLLGDFTITIPDFFRILFGADIPPATFILMQSKLPAAVVGTLAGLAFGSSGAVFQTMLRNPLASPDVIGVTLGSSAAAVFSSVILGWGSAGMSIAALVGGLVVAAAVQFFSGEHGSATGRMILVGIGIAAALQAVIQWVLLKANIYQAQDAMVWLTGSLNAMPWSGAVRLGITVAILLPLTCAISRSLQALEMGDDTAQALGVRASRSRLTLMGVVVLMTAVATSVCGPIAFIGLLSGPIARRLNGGRPSILLAAAVGACIVVGGDYLASYGIPGTPLPVGVVTGLAGAPVLLVLLIGSRRIVKDG